MKFFKYISILLVIFASLKANAQNYNYKEDASFTVKGIVKDSEDNAPISDVEIQVNGGNYTTTLLDGTFRIKVKKGDEVVVKVIGFDRGKVKLSIKEAS